MPVLTKMEFVEAIAAETGILKKQALQALETVLNKIAESLASGDEVSLSGIGKLKTYDREAKIGRNPKTGEQITIAPKRAIRFKPAAALVSRVAGQQ